MIRRLQRGTRPSKTATMKMRLIVFPRDDYTCQGCGWQPQPVPSGYDGRFCPWGPAPAPTTTREMRLRESRLLTLGHILPASEGGEFEETNLRAECTRCNYGGGNTIKAAHNRGLTIAGEPWQARWPVMTA
jgi:5-methylcytosine-specific restriction endonuclease McrA